MARQAPQNDAGFGSDSFTDVVTNVVGILIILVLVVGIRVQRSPPAADVPPPSDLAALQAAARDLESQSAAAAGRQAALRRRAAAGRLEQARLTGLIADQEARRAAEAVTAADSAGQEKEQRRDHAAARAYLEQLEEDRAEIESSRPRTVTIESYPTPLSHAVSGDEAHFQLRGGRLALIPLDELLGKLRSDAVQQVWKLRDLPEATDTVGPVGGWRMRYTMQRVDVTLQSGSDGRRSGSYAQLSAWTLIPVETQLGEPLAEALAEGSAFRREVARLDPRRISVTVWTYPDSFAEFRALKKELYRLGFATAGRPLPEDHPIGGSPQGSKSAAQ